MVPVLSTGRNSVRVRAGRGAGLPYLPHLSTKLRQRGTYIHLFPSCCLNLYPDHLVGWIFSPPRKFLESCRGLVE